LHTWLADSDAGGVYPPLVEFAHHKAVRPEPVEGSPRSGWRFVMRLKSKPPGVARQQVKPELKGDPGLPPLRGALRCSTGQAAAELALRAQTVLADIP